MDGNATNATARVPNAMRQALKEARRQMYKEMHEQVIQASRDLNPEVMATEYEQLAHLSLAHARATLPEADYSDAIRGAAIATDKMQLLRGQATSISQSLPTDPQTARAKLLEILAQHSTDTEVLPPGTTSNQDDTTPGP